MSNQLTLNTASLEELKARVNALPEPEIMQDGKTATPTEATQTIVPDSGFGGLSSVTVNPIPDNYEDRTESLPQLNTVNGGTEAATMAAAVDNTDTLVSDENTLIEQAIAALEGKSGGTVLLQEKTVTPSTPNQEIEPDSGYDGLSKVTVDGDADLIAENIKSGISIFGVTGTYDPVLQEKSITPTTSTQIITADDGYDGLSKVNINGDADLIAENIKSGISIFGVTGSYGGSGGGSGGNASFIGEFANVTDNGMYEPGANEYVLDYSNCDVDLSNVRCMLIGKYEDNSGYFMGCIYFNESQGLYSVLNQATSMGLQQSPNIVIDRSTKTITLVCSDSSIVNRKGFEAYFI